MQLNEISLLEKKFKKKKFNCKIESLNDYLHKRANQDMKKRIASCFVLTNVNNEILGYYTLSNSSVLKDLMPESVRKKIPYKDLPVTLLGRLAVDSNFQGNGLGAFILMDALYRSYTISIEIASAAVIVDPINEDAKSFYEKYGFIELPNSKRMFLPMKSVALLFNI